MKANLALPTLPSYSPNLNQVENVRANPRANRRAISVRDSYDDILDVSCNAWSVFANDAKTIASITSRSWAQVS